MKAAVKGTISECSVFIVELDGFIHLSSALHAGTAQSQRGP